MDTGLRHEYAEWLGSLPWSYFITVTFRWPVHRQHAPGILNSVAKSLKKWQPHMVFLGAEEHQSRYLHLHGLMCNRLYDHKPGPVPLAAVVWEDLFKTFGYSRVELIRDTGDAARYVTKYCVKALAEYVVV